MLKSPPIHIGLPDIRQIGFRIRSARRRKKLTQAHVAARAGIDKAHLSRIERGEKTASLGTLHMLSVALDTSLSLLLGESNPKDEIRVNRAEERQPAADTKALANEGHYKTLLAGGMDSPLSMMMVQVSKQGLKETAVHGGEEVIFVLEGRVRVQFDQHGVVLGKYDSVSFPGYLSHSLCAEGTKIARVLIAIAGDSL
ncbi:helix-turn-helix domain-containing protein [Allopusillimonas ginsengisoli]|uniref:helix-turn-helix domain-containing protein n=1 Tax=Allopusillimonas ginsengisoli TaxID=453575 RepID=UPI001FD6FEDA|nr:XRE family transcriptional regulator [Allopusillimonas ginsengisoli]